MKPNLALTTLFLVSTLLMNPFTDAARLHHISTLDNRIIQLHFQDGVVEFLDDASGPTAFGGHSHEARLNWVVAFGEPLQTQAAQLAANWRIHSDEDERYGPSGLQPVAVHRKSKLNGMAEMDWNHDTNDFDYEHTMEHFLYMELPYPLKEWTAYTVSIAAAVNSDVAKIDFVFASERSLSEAIKVNLAGYWPDAPIMAADVYAWLGDGGPRDYTRYEGAAVRLLNQHTGQSQKVGSLQRSQLQGTDVGGYKLMPDRVWHADFTGIYPEGKYRLVVDGIGASQPFRIARDVFREPLRVSTLGYFYMRIGQDSMDMTPVPRRPLWYPVGHPEYPQGHPEGFRVVKTSMHPFHPDWNTFSLSPNPVKTDPWDGKHVHWQQYILADWPENPNAWGGYSDALDWDRHLGHVSSIYDILLPYILTGGAIGEDDFGIAESGNGIPDLLDSARYEVDFWLRLRDDCGYAHGISDIDTDVNIAHQAAATGMAAWANATNTAMLADAFRIAGLPELSAYYLNAAMEAYSFASRLPTEDQMLELQQNVGEGTFRGSDFRATAAAFLFNLTGDRSFENVFAEAITAQLANGPIEWPTTNNLLYASVGYLFSPHAVADPTLREQLRLAIIDEARRHEARFSSLRPSRRGTDNESGYFHTIQNMHRSMVAHAVSKDLTEQLFFLRAMLLEAGWGLGRNPLNIIQMTTATTGLADKRSIQNAYTSGRNDGTPGLHPGHTPYLNIDDWAPGMIMGTPSWMVAKGHPVDANAWPRAEMYYSTRFVWSHSEFTPQQTMRGKQALYGYLYGLSLRP